MKKNAALYLIMLLLAGVSSAEVNAGATISDRRYWPNEARGSPGQTLEISPLYTYPARAPVLGQPRLRPPRKAGKYR